MEKELTPKETSWNEVHEDIQLIHFEQYWIVRAKDNLVVQALFCDLQTEGIDNAWVIHDTEYPLSFATHYTEVIVPVFHTHTKSSN